ncbi:adenylyltransferase/cytidyltransferase family protein [Candidatus Nomurabacteria bacterium]|nr:adenylyltransferase/cytidyltransferase family protein [Candidatus Nomurabacteria bacterium]
MKKTQKKTKKVKKNKKQITVAVSGGFDPIHIGHVRMIKEAKKMAGENGELVVILNNDNWLRSKKGFVFMPEVERKEIIEHIKWVDKVIITSHKPNTDDISVCKDLCKLKPHIFANGGDRTKKNIPELDAGGEWGMKMVFGVGRGGKVQSSSDLVKKVKGVKI